MDFSPLAIILVKNGSRGDKLLFRYPFTDSKQKPSDHGKRKNHYAKPDPEGHIDFPEQGDQSKGDFSDLPDEVMSHLFAVNNKLSRQKFELKVNDVRFVGHPVKLQKSDFHNEKGCPITLFHVVFALQAKLPYQIIDCYYELSRRMSAILRYEEGRCQFLYEESQIMINAQEEACQEPGALPDAGFQLAVSRSLLAQHLKKCYEQLSSQGSIDVFFNGWIHLSYRIPQRKLNCLGRHNILTAEFLETGFEYIKPFHTILFTVDKQEILDQLAPDTSPTLKRLIKIHSPILPMYDLSANADLTIDHVYKLALHLVFWGKATMIYPVCAANVYVLSHRTPMTRKLVNEFKEDFPKLSYASTLAEYSLPISISDKRHPLTSHEDEQLENDKLIWLLKRGLLQQLHTFIYILPVASEPTPRTVLGGPLPTVTEAPSERSELEACADEVVFGDQKPRLNSVPLNRNDQQIYDATLLQLKCTLSPPEFSRLMKCKFANNLEDLKQFSQLCQFFRGQHTIEEIMYRSNLKRSKILDVLDKFPDILACLQDSDPSVDFLPKICK